MMFKQLEVTIKACALISLMSCTIFVKLIATSAARPMRLNCDNTQIYDDDVVSHVTQSFPSLFLFGDSLTDTGNGPFVNKSRAMSYPYGITFPGYPFGRNSDGRIVADYLAGYLSLPPVNPWLDVSLNFTYGANYAIPGASILPNFSSPFPLSQQISWHLDLVQQVSNMTASTTSRMLTQNMKVDTPFQGMPEWKSNLPSQESLGESLYVLQFGVSDFKINVIDYNKSAQWTIDNIIPLVIEETQSALEILYSDGGARNFVVMGSPAHGCISASLATLPNSAKDSHGCVASLNDVAWNHRQQLLNLLQNLQELHDDATYTFVDLFSANVYIIDHANQFGFTNVFGACCRGSEFPYNNTDFPCLTGTTPFYLCPDPNNHINWDGSHFTTNFCDQLFNQTFVTKSFIYEFKKK